MKFDRAVSGKTFAIPTDGTALNNPHFCMALLCVVAKWIPGNIIEFNQEDLDSVGGMFLAEGWDSNGNFLIKLMTRKEANAPDH